MPGGQDCCPVLVCTLCVIAHVRKGVNMGAALHLAAPLLEPIGLSLLGPLGTLRALAQIVRCVKDYG